MPGPWPRDSMHWRANTRFTSRPRGKNGHDGFHDRFLRAHQLMGARVFGENVHRVTAGPDPARRLVGAWIASKAHRANIESRIWNKTGIGTHTAASGTVWAVQVFGAVP